MAAALLKAHILTTGIDPNPWIVESAGVRADPGHPASPMAQQVMAARSLDISAHRSQKVSAELLAGFDRIYCMEVGHLEVLASAFPLWKERVMLLSQAAGRVENISDPYGGSLEDYQRTAQQIEDCIKQSWVSFFEL